MVVQINDFAEFQETILENIYRSLLSPGDKAIDLGSHRARHSFPMAECVGEDGTVFCIEASAITAEKFRAQVHRIQIPNIKNIIKLFEVGVSDREKEIKFYYYPQAAGWSGEIKREDYPHDDYQETVIKIVKLDNLIDVKDLTKLKFIKADIEGNEFPSFKGAINILEKFRPLIVFENSLSSNGQQFSYSENDFFSFFDNLGYELRTILGEKLTRDAYRNGASCWYFVALDKINKLHNEAHLNGISKTIAPK